MKRIHILIAMILCLNSYKSIAQGENNFWAFGRNCGFDFSNGIPVLIKTGTSTSEGCAAASDAQGHFLFYSDGNTVWGRDKQIMPHGTGLLGNSGGFSSGNGSSTQGVTIIPFIDDTNRYYLFTTDCIESHTDTYPGYLRYNIIDMRLNNGNGDVDTNYKNIIIDSFMSEKAYPVKGAGCYTWLITHRYGSFEFLAYKIDAGGLNLVPVSSVTSTLDSALYDSYVACELKVSADTRLLATAPHFGYIELFSFDNSTGRVSNARKLDAIPGIGYGLGFSPQGTKLYTSHAWGRALQYDLGLLPDINAVRGSAVAITDSGMYGSFRTGPDNKIYFPTANANIMHCINEPDKKGTACNVTTLSLNPDNDMHFQIGLGNPVVVAHVIKGSSTDTITCLGTELTIAAPVGYPSYEWNDGDSLSSKTIDKPGVYTITTKGLCLTETDTFNVQMQDCNCIVSIPTAFSPNNDGKNDRFKIITGDLESFHMEVYSRYGQAVFYTSYIGHSWDGTYNGSLCETGTYYYFVRLKCIQGREVFRKGDVTLLR